MSTVAPIDPQLRASGHDRGQDSRTLTLPAAALLPPPGLDHELEFPAMGTTVRLLIGSQLQAGLPRPEGAATREQDWLRDFECRLSRFASESELSALNRDPRTEVPVSPLLGAAVQAGIRAAEITSGLCDPTLVDEIERAGYRGSRAGAEPAPLEEALRGAGLPSLGPISAGEP